MGTEEAQLQGIVIGDYQMLRPLGRGAFAAVYLAEDRKHQRQVAMKILPEEIYEDTTVVERFLREVRVASQLHHPNIVQFYDLFDFEGMHCFTMEYVPGGSLGELLSHGPLEEEQAVRLLKQVGGALEYAHAAGVVHRDVKPDNLLMAENGELKLCDLGLAQAQKKEERANLTLEGFTVGTPYYMSPEQIRGDTDVDERSDIYSLGATMYHMLTGQVPFDGGSAAEIMAKHLNEPVPSPKRLNFKLSNEICYVVVRMMAKRKEDRYAECGHLLNDIRRVERRYAQLKENVSFATPPPIKIDESEPSLVSLGEAGEPLAEEAPKGDEVKKIFDDAEEDGMKRVPKGIAPAEEMAMLTSLASEEVMEGDAEETFAALPKPVPLSTPAIAVFDERAEYGQAMAHSQVRWGGWIKAICAQGVGYSQRTWKQIVTRWQKMNGRGNEAE